jgi:hypothetical protein
MLCEVSLADDAPWKQRFRAQTILGTQIAGAAWSRIIYQACISPAPGKCPAASCDH